MKNALALVLREWRDMKKAAPVWAGKGNEQDEIL